MPGRLIGGAVSSLAGLGGLFLGLMFVIASGGTSSRLIPGFIFLAVGAVLLILGLKIFIKGLRKGASSQEQKDRSSAVPQFKVIMKYCPYCGNDYPVRENIETCPSCGSDLKMKKTGKEGGDDLFSMDT